MDFTNKPGTSPKPFSIDITGWTLILGGISSFVMIFLYPAISSFLETGWLRDALNPEWVYGLLILTGICYTVAGLAIINHRMWGRTLFLAFEPLHIVLSYLLYLNRPYAAYLNAINIFFYGIFAWMLTLPSSNAWFAGTYKKPEKDEERKLAIAAIRKGQRNHSITAQVFGILFATGACFLFGMMDLIIGFSRHVMFNYMTTISGLTATVVLLPGILLWGRQRWAGLTGWTLSAAGTWAIIEGVSLVFIIQTAYWQTLAKQLPAAAVAGFTYETFATIIMGGCVIIFIGVSLLKYQYRNDEKAAGIRMADSGKTAAPKEHYVLTGHG